MQTEKQAHRFWIVREGNAVLAGIVLDYFYQVSDVIFRTVNPTHRRVIKELVTSHIVQFQACRTFSLVGGILQRSVRNPNLTESDSDDLMSFERISEEIKKLEDKELDYQVGRANVALIDGDYPSHQVVFDKAVNYIGQTYGVKLTYKAVPSNLGETQLTVEFTIHNTHKFRLWKDVPTPDDRYEHTKPSSWGLLHICPSYHPHFSGAQGVGLINGATDAFIGQHDLGIDSIYCPKEARIKKGEFLFGTWSKVKHPFYAEGKTLEMKISFIRILSQKSYELLLRVLLGALNLEHIYLRVSGGFDSPYPYPQQPRMYREVRGSEHDVVWEYRTLVKEKKLKGSIIPQWFMEEHWLEAYPEKDTARI